jgi:UDP-glucose 4-epimerase
VKRALVTGGAGFVGSHLVDRLVSEYEVVVLDDLSGGSLRNIEQHQDRENFVFHKGTITSKADLEKALEGVDLVFHLAAQPDVLLSNEKPIADFQINVVGSLLLLEKMREHAISKLVFASSGGTVYGETEIMPTPESTAFKPISNYGAAKGAVEMYMSSFAELYGIDSVSMRYGNIIGPRLTHGVVYDFYTKLKRTPLVLEVLGNGLQEKSYLSVDDAVDAAVILADKLPSGFTPVNVSSGERMQVRRIAEIVVDELHLPDVHIRYSEDERGWVGDVRKTDLDIGRLKSYGWSAKTSTEDAIRMMVQWLVQEFGPISQ